MTVDQAVQQWCVEHGAEGGDIYLSRALLIEIPGVPDGRKITKPALINIVLGHQYALFNDAAGRQFRVPYSDPRVLDMLAVALSGGLP